MGLESTSKVRIREAALARFAREGLDGITMRGIAKEVGVSAPAIYRHYPNRNSILADICSYGFLSFVKIFDEPIEEVDCNERIQTLAHRYLTWAMDNPELFDLLYAYDALQKQKRMPRAEGAEQGAEASIRVLVREVEKCIDCGAWRKEDAWTVALTLWAIGRGLYALYWTGRIGASADEMAALCRRSIGMLIAGLEARQSRPPSTDMLRERDCQ